MSKHHLESVSSRYLRRATESRSWLVAAAAAVAGLAALRRRPWLTGLAALAGLAASRLSRASSELRPGPARSTFDEPDPVRPLDPEVTVTSMGYPAPPTVTVGPVETPST